MARQYALVQVAIWQDDDFRALPPEAQHLYFLMLTSPSLNLAGVCDWRPNRIAKLSGGWTAARVRNAATALTRAGYILVDEESEEAVVRTFVKHDGVLRNPKTAAGMMACWAGAFSLPIRNTIASEVEKVAREGVKDSVRSIIAPMLDHFSNQVLDWVSDQVSDTQSGEEGDYLSDQVPDSPSFPHTLNLHTLMPSSVGARKRGTRLDPEWIPSPESRAKIITEHPTLDLKREHEKFADYWTAQAGQKGVKLDWDATWRNWMRRAAESTRSRPTRQQETDQMFDAAMQRARAADAADAAGQPIEGVIL